MSTTEVVENTEDPTDEKTPEEIDSLFEDPLVQFLDAHEEQFCKCIYGSMEEGAFDSMVCSIYDEAKKHPQHDLVKRAENLHRHGKRHFRGLCHKASYVYTIMFGLYH